MDERDVRAAGAGAGAGGLGAAGMPDRPDAANPAGAADPADADGPGATDLRTDDAANGPDEAAQFDARVLRAFVRDGRLITIPAQQRKRTVILRWLAETCFAEDEAYPERDVNMRLALVHPDVAALRRYLVEAGLMTRAAGVYRRVPKATT